jgi:V/A-type H+-transporting ATPase subunit E
MEDLKSQLNFLKEVQVKEIIEEAKDQAAKLVKEARAKAEQVKSKEREEALQKARETEEQELESARVQGRRKAMDARFRLIEMALAKSLDRLKELTDRQDASYVNGIERFVVDAAAMIAGTESEVVLNPRDVAFVKRKLGRIEKRVSTIKGAPTKLQISDEPLRSIGGVMVRSKDGKQIFNNTLEAKLAKVRQEMLSRVGDALLEGASD